jgi:hypothetical protein
MIILPVLPLVPTSWPLTLAVGAVGVVLIAWPWIVQAVGRWRRK